MNGVEYVVEDTGAFARYGVQFDVYYDNHAAASAHGHQTWEAYIADSNGNQEVQVTTTKEVNRLDVTMTNHSLDAVLRSRMTEEEQERYGTRAAYVILSEEGTVVMNDCYNGFDEEARRNIQNFMQQQAEQAQQKQQEMQAQAQTGQTQSGETQKKKPELANWQKVMDNGEYLRSAEMAEEANYNMIDGLMNNTPKKKDKNAPRRSVLKRLRNHQKKIASQGKGQPQQQKAMEEEMERKKK